MWGGRGSAVLDGTTTTFRMLMANGWLPPKPDSNKDRNISGVPRRGYVDQRVAPELLGKGYFGMLICLFFVVRPLYTHIAGPVFPYVTVFI